MSKNIGKILFRVSYGPDVSRRRAQIVAWSQVLVVHSSGPGPWDLHAWRDTPRDLRGPHSEVEVRTWAMHYVMFNFPFNFSVLLIFPH